MLRKLLKHEFRATGRIMLPLYLILLATAIGANFSTRGLLETDLKVLDLLGGLLVMAFAVAIIAVCVMSMVVMVQRFYKNLLQDEGYVMMTLPVSVHQQVWSKLIVSAVWFALTIVMVCLAGLIMAFDIDILEGIGEVFHEIFQHVTAYYALNGTAIAIGHSFSGHKMAWSVAWYFIIQFAVQFVGGMLVTLLDESWLHHLLLGWTDNISGMAAVHFGMCVLIVGELVYGAVFYLLTTYFLKRRLNLE